MNNNIFQFSDCYYLQLSGTAMGTPPACMWATLYFAPHEDETTALYSDFLLYYARYIDDGFGIWNWTGTPECINAWNSFQVDMNNYGRLRWDFSEPRPTVNYLDITLTVNNGRIHSTLYEKALNLYLYLPPHSCHPPGVLKGLLSGMLLRILRLTTDPSTRQAHVQQLFDRLVARGYRRSHIKPIFLKYLHRYFTTEHLPIMPLPTGNPNPGDIGSTIFLHLPYHPLDPPSSAIQRLFKKEIMKDSAHPTTYFPNRVPFYRLKNYGHEEIGINRLIVAYHRHRNLGEILAPRKFDRRPGPSFSDYVFSSQRDRRGRQQQQQLQSPQQRRPHAST